MLLTRLLVPGAFGAMAIVLSSSSLVAALSDVGVWPAVIQSPRGGDDSYLNAAWWFGMVRALFIYVILFAAAPWISRFYGNPELSPLLRVTLIATIFEGMISPRAKLALKEMKFGRLAMINNGGAICGVVLTIVLSVLLKNVWALAIGYCAENAFRCLLSYILCPGVASLEIDMHAVRDLMKFTGGTIGLSFLNLIFLRADIFVLGKLYSPGELGVYTMAVNLVQTPANFVISMATTMLMPVFSHVQADKARMNRILREVTSWFTLLGLPAVAAIWLCGSSLLTVIYGARYAEATGPLAVGICVVFLNVLNSLVTVLFYAAGRPGLHRRAVAVSAITMLIAVYPACRYMGVIGGQVAALLAIFTGYVLQVVRARDITGLTISRYCRAFVPATVMAGGILLAGIGAQVLGFGARPVTNIAIAGVMCAIAYLACVPVFAKIKELA
jgi:O-antigen/teichoic acid export membrane protein